MKLDKKYMLLGLCIVIFLNAHGQFKNYNTEREIWYLGTVYDRDNHSIEGLINYNFVVDNIRFKVDNEITTLIPKNISKFILEYSSSIKYEFYSIPFDFQKRGKEVPTFFS